MEKGLKIEEGEGGEYIIKKSRDVVCNVSTISIDGLIDYINKPDPVQEHPSEGRSDPVAMASNHLQSH
jgi:hypothetical protein